VQFFYIIKNNRQSFTTIDDYVTNIFLKTFFATSEALSEVCALLSVILVQIVSAAQVCCKSVLSVTSIRQFARPFILCAS